MARVNATRGELQATKNRIELAQQGQELLEEKRDALMQELLSTAQEVLRSSEELSRRVGSATRALAWAQAMDGPEAVRSAALAAQGQVTLDVRISNIMGVTIPEIERKSVARGPLDRGYSLPGVSSRVQVTARAFEDLIDLILELAAAEMRLRRLADEIGRTTRRVNALEHVRTPELEEERDYIQRVLDEREREDLFRLKRVKKKRER